MSRRDLAVEKGKWLTSLAWDIGANTPGYPEEWAETLGLRVIEIMELQSGSSQSPVQDAWLEHLQERRDNV